MCRSPRTAPPIASSRRSSSRPGGRCSAKTGPCCRCLRPAERAALSPPRIAPSGQSNQWLGWMPRAVQRICRRSPFDTGRAHRALAKPHETRYFVSLGGRGSRGGRHFMNRRSVLRAIGLFSTSPLWMHVSALAQGSLKGSNTPPKMPTPVQTKDSPELIRVGLPSDWKLDLPKQWKNDGGVLSRTPPKRQGSGIFVSGVKAENAGKELRFGSLDPVGQAVPTTPEMSKLVGTTA